MIKFFNRDFFTNEEETRDEEQCVVVRVKSAIDPSRIITTVICHEKLNKFPTRVKIISDKNNPSKPLTRISQQDGLNYDTDVYLLAIPFTNDGVFESVKPIRGLKFCKGLTFKPVEGEGLTTSGGYRVEKVLYAVVIPDQRVLEKENIDFSLSYYTHKTTASDGNDMIKIDKGDKEKPIVKVTFSFRFLKSKNEESNDGVTFMEHEFTQEVIEEDSVEIDSFRNKPILPLFDPSKAASKGKEKSNKVNDKPKKNFKPKKDNTDKGTEAADNPKKYTDKKPMSKKDRPDDKYKVTLKKPTMNLKLEKRYIAKPDGTSIPLEPGVIRKKPNPTPEKVKETFVTSNPHADEPVTSQDKLEELLNKFEKDSNDRWASSAAKRNRNRKKRK